MDGKRQDKNGDWKYVKDRECGSCAHYCFEEEEAENRCDGWSTTYYCRIHDTCNRYEESKDVHWYGGGCFLTTAACDYKGLPDDCYELQTMRRVRDEILLPTEYGKVIVKRYYEIAPGIVENIEKHPDREHILDYIFREITAIVSYIEEERMIEAVARYVELTYDVDEMTRKVDE